jgi:hypothetical protein
MAWKKYKDMNSLEDETSSENWSAAAIYSKSKIAMLLVLLDIHENVALYGTSNVEDNSNPPLTPQQIVQKRFDGIKRLSTTMRQLLGNTLFGIRKVDMWKYESFLIRIKSIQDVLDGCVYYNTNYITRREEMVINEKHFNVCFTQLQKIKDDINVILNNAGLIFRTNEDEDINKLISEIASGG